MPDRQNAGLAGFLRRHVRPGMVVIDVGANTGTITAVAADAVGPTGRVIAFEPSPETAASLRERFRGVSAVEVREAAVSDSAGTMDFHLDAVNSKRHTLFTGASSVRERAIQVRVVTLDDECLGGPRVDLIKSDAQGADGRILAGARRLLLRDRPLLVFELWPAGLAAAGTSPAALLDDLANLGYRCMRMSVKGPLKSAPAIAAFLAQPSRWASTNIVAWPPVWPQRDLRRALRAWLFHLRHRAPMR